MSTIHQVRRHQETLKLRTISKEQQRVARIWRIWQDRKSGGPSQSYGDKTQMRILQIDADFERLFLAQERGAR